MLIHPIAGIWLSAIWGRRKRKFRTLKRSGLDVGGWRSSKKPKGGKKVKEVTWGRKVNLGKFEAS